MTIGKKLNVLIASFLEEEYIRLIADVDSRIDVVYRPDLLRTPRYVSDHVGAPWERTPAQEREWRKYLASADVLFDFDQTHQKDLPDLAPNVKWIQATGSGIGQFVASMNYGERMPNTLITNTSGVHGQPLAEFCLMVMLTFRKRLGQMVQNQSQKIWERFTGTDLEGSTVVIVGLGAIGEEVARVCRTFRMTVIGVGRSSGPADAPSFEAEYYSVNELKTVLPRAEHLVLVTPHTPETENLIGAEELALMPPGAVLINIGRGVVLDEKALIEALASGHLGGAGLDVFAEEPLPADSPLWAMSNVLVSPHSSGTTDQENRRITQLFCENLRRFLTCEPLLNVVDPARFY